MKDQFEVLSVFKLFHKEILTQFSSSIKILCSGNVLEYMQAAFQEYCVLFDIIHHTTCAHILQQNSVAKRKNHHLLDIAHVIIYLTLHVLL